MRQFGFGFCGKRDDKQFWARRRLDSGCTTEAVEMAWARKQYSK